MLDSTHSIAKTEPPGLPTANFESIKDPIFQNCGITGVSMGWPRTLRQLPHNALPIDHATIAAAGQTLANPTIDYQCAPANRSLSGILAIHEIDLRRVATELLNLPSVDRPYLRLLDLGCGERLFSLNAVPYFESWGRNTRLTEGWRHYSDYYDPCYKRPEMRVVHLSPIPVIEYGLDCGKFPNPTADDHGLFRVNFYDPQQLNFFLESIPNGFFDIVVATCFFGPRSNGIFPDYVLPNRENLKLFEDRLNPQHGVMLVATADSLRKTSIDGTPIYGKIETWPRHGGGFIQGDRTYLSRSLDLEQYRWNVFDSVFKAGALIRAAAQQTNSPRPEDSNSILQDALRFA